MVSFMNKHVFEKERYFNAIAKELNIVWLRWVFLFTIAPFYVWVFDRPISIYFVAILILCIIYNFINYVTLINKIYPFKWFENNIYFDIIFISLLIYFDNGFQSLIFICYYIFIIYEGIKRGIPHPIFLSLGAIGLYSIIVYFLIPDQANNIGSMIFRNLFIFISGFFVSDVLNELNRYDSLHKKEYNLARKDKLTGLFNRNELDKVLNEDLLECIKQKSSLCVLMFDIDNFKSFNDAYGHLTGDDLLRFFSKIIIETISPKNKAFRYGGEEFLVELKDTDLNEAYKIAEIIRKKLSNSNIFVKTEEGRQKITVSCGLACCPEHSAGYFELLDYADKALYEAKSEGKNKVVIAEKEV